MEASKIAVPTIAQEASKFKISAKNINVARLRDASEQTEKVLVRNLQPAVVQYMRSEYDKCAVASRRSGRFADLIAFQQFLMQIPKWSSAQIAEVSKQVIGGGAFKFYETLKFLLVAKVFLMASVRSFDGQESNNALSMPMPTLDDYIHRVLFLAARELFVAPSLIRLQADSYELEAATNHQLLNAVVERSVKDAVIDLVPHDHIMDTYLSETLKGVTFEIPSSSAEPLALPAQVAAAILEPVLPAAPVKLADIVALAEQKKPEEETAAKPEEKEKEKAEAEVEVEDDSGSDSDAVELSSESESGSESESESVASSSSEEEEEEKPVKKPQHKKKKDKKAEKAKNKHTPKKASHSPKKHNSSSSKKAAASPKSTRQVKIPEETVKA